MKIEELNKETLKDLIESDFHVADAIEHPEQFKEIGLDPAKIDEIRKKLLTLSLEILSQGKVDETELIRSCIHILGRCSIKEKELYGSIIDCLMGYMNRDFTFAIEATRSIERLADAISPEMWEGQNRVEHLVHLIETGDDMSSWNAAYALARLAAKADRKSLQAHISRVLNVVRLNAGFRKAHAISALGKLYKYADLKEEILNILLLAAQDPDENTRRATIFALEDCISEETKDKILNMLEDLLEDEARTVKYGALEALTEALPYKISGRAFKRILSFLKADEPWIRWRAVLTMNKAYPELDGGEKEKAVAVLRELIEDEDIFVKVRAYEALLNIKDLEKRKFPQVDERLNRESDFVRHWILYNFEQR